MRNSHNFVGKYSNRHQTYRSGYGREKVTPPPLPNCFLLKHSINDDVETWSLSSYMLSVAANFAPFKIDFHTDDLDAFGITGTPANFIAVSKKLKKRHFNML
jgi:hypothetical protein